MWSATVAATVGLLGLPLALSRGELAVEGGLVGWLIPTLTGVIGGSWVISRHGSVGTGFIAAVVGCILARLFLAAVGAMAVAGAGAVAAWAYLTGLGVAFVAQQTTEVVWILRAARPAGGETRPC